MLTWEQYLIKSMVPQTNVNQSNQISGTTQLKYWLRNSNAGPNRDQSKYSISALVIWAICFVQRKLLIFFFKHFLLLFATLTTNLLVTLAATMPNAMIYKDECSVKMFSGDFWAIINAGNTTKVKGILGDNTLVP